MIRELLVIAGLLVAMGVLYVLVRWGAGHWNHFWGAQADKIDVSPRDPYPSEAPQHRSDEEDPPRPTP